MKPPVAMRTAYSVFDALGLDPIFDAVMERVMARCPICGPDDGDMWLPLRYCTFGGCRIYCAGDCANRGALMVIEQSGGVL